MEFIWPPSSSITRPWIPFQGKELVKTNETTTNSMRLRRFITEFLRPPFSSIITSPQYHHISALSCDIQTYVKIQRNRKPGSGSNLTCKIQRGEIIRGFGRAAAPAPAPAPAGRKANNRPLLSVAIEVGVINNADRHFADSLAGRIDGSLGRGGPAAAGARRPPAVRAIAGEGPASLCFYKLQF
ncbi:hypothetical protein EVAR_74877_1 [Eumeta japonica]|uniref:Uncharacterized protein n=1 Tax=Eumeta variegata TaxID=151549 RepID=A0A4C1SSX9_EUMVA|nr:hypothetical protein EVAR_74877_1 [Eumeta japonica]